PAVLNRLRHGAASSIFLCRASAPQLRRNARSNAGSVEANLPPRDVLRYIALVRGKHHGWAGGGRGPWPPPWGPPFSWAGGGPRVRRGNVRAAILALLVERPMHGYEMIQELEARSGGIWRPSAGSIYPTLQLLEDQGLVKSEDVED